MKKQKIEKRVLLAIDGSFNAFRAVEYVATIFKEDPVFKISVVYVTPPLPPILYETSEEQELIDWQSSYRSKLEKKYRQQADEILGKVTNFLKDNGWSEEQFETIALPGRSGPAQDLLFYAEQGLFDALVMGRRGKTKWEKMIMGSVTDKIIHAQKTVPIWIIIKPIVSQKILLAIDGSENAMRAVDHVGFVLSGRTDVEVTIFHVLDLKPFVILEKPPQKWQEIAEKKMATFMSQAKNMLVGAGVPEEKINLVIRPSDKGVAQEIIEYQKKESISTITMGRRGLSRLKAFFLGSVSTKVLNMIEEGAVWIVD